MPKTLKINNWTYSFQSDGITVIYPVQAWISGPRKILVEKKLPCSLEEMLLIGKTLIEGGASVNF